MPKLAFEKKKKIALKIKGQTVTFMRTFHCDCSQKNLAVKTNVIAAEESARASNTFSECCMYVCLQQTAV